MIFLGLKLEPGLFTARMMLLLAYEAKGMYEEMLDLVNRTIAWPNPIVALENEAYVLANLGRTDEARHKLRRSRNERRTSTSRRSGSRKGTSRDERDAAFHWLERAYRDFRMISLGAGARFDALRSDPRFDELLRRVGFRQSAIP
jgi:hypothetical protein